MLGSGLGLFGNTWYRNAVSGMLSTEMPWSLQV